MKRLLILILFFQNLIVSEAAILKYAVYFTDKANSSYSITSPQDFLSLKSIQRRLKEGVILSEQDLPVSTTYLSQLNAITKVHYVSKWLNAAIISHDEVFLSDVESLPFVDRIEYLGPSNFINARLDKTQEKLELEETISSINNNLIGVDEIKAQNITGKGVLLASLDAGFPGVNTMDGFVHVFDHDGVIDTYDFVNGNKDVYSNHYHGTATLSLIAGNIPDVFYSPAPEVDLLLYITEDVNSEYRIEEYNWISAAERADSVGVDIITSSLGYTDFDDLSMDYTSSQLDGKTSVITRAADWAASKGIIVITSAGNYGNNSWYYVGMPADCFTCVSVGSVDAGKVQSVFSSFGPTADWRIKPDLMAMGSAVPILFPDNSMPSFNGTSLAAPQVAGLFAALFEAFPNHTSEQIKEAVFISADRYSTPDNQYGYGIPNFVAASNYLELNEAPNKILEVYPTLVTNKKIFVKTIAPNLYGPFSYRIISVIGQTVQSGQSELNWLQPSLELPILDVSEGIYMIVFEFQDKVFKSKIVIR